MQGLHILAELHDCSCERSLLHELPPLRTICLEACSGAGLGVVAETFHAFGTPEAPSGATGAVVLAESHLAVHTWPELGAVTLDLYVCNYSRDNSAAAAACFERLATAFRPGRIVRRDVRRGRPD
jgi:spermidine synthase/S-adenosylmethionine decarboxylase